MSESEDRRRRSIALLEAQGVPYYEDLPRLASSDEAVIPTAEKVAQRAACLLAISIGAVNRMRDDTVETLRNWGLMEALTPKERRFLLCDPWPEQDRVQFCWRCEASFPLMWAVRMVEDLPYPDQIVDLDWLGDRLLKARAGVRQGYELRDANDILDQADLTYRYHWAVRDARLKGLDPPAALEPGVVQERHYALNWLIGYYDEGWDDVSTNT